MNALYKNPIAILLSILVIASFVYFEKELPAIDLSHLTPGNVIAMLGYISVIMLVVEQFIEIFVDDPNEKVKIQCKDRITDINKFLEQLNNPLDIAALTDAESTEEKPESVEVVKMIKEKKELEEFLTTRGLKRQKRTTLIAFVIGLILSFSGLRLMAGIVFNGSETELSNIQMTIIQSIDIVLTSGIIAGGSGRVHRLMKRIKETMGGPSINSL